MEFFLSRTGIWLFSIKVSHLWLTYNLLAMQISFFQVAKYFSQKEKPVNFDGLLKTSGTFSFLNSLRLCSLNRLKALAGSEGNGQGAAVCAVTKEFRNHSGIAEIIELKEKVGLNH